MIDPLLLTSIAFGFAVLFTGSAWHKLSAPASFEAVLRDYQLVPVPLHRPLSFLIPVFELMLGLCWMSGLLTHFTALASIGLLTIYALAMSINLKRGRIYIDCGCGFGPSDKDQALSSSLVSRNILLIGLVTLSFVPATERDLQIPDYVVVFATVLIAGLLYAGAGQLITNRSAIVVWRGK